MPGTKLYTQNKLGGKVQGLEKGKLDFPDRIGDQEVAYFAAGWLALSPTLSSTPPPPNEQTVLTVLRDSERFCLGGQWAVDSSFAGPLTSRGPRTSTCARGALLHFQLASTQKPQSYFVDPVPTPLFYQASSSFNPT